MDRFVKRYAGLYRLDGSIGVFLFRYSYGVENGKRSVINHMQDVTEQYEEYTKLPPLLF